MTEVNGSLILAEYIGTYDTQKLNPSRKKKFILQDLARFWQNLARRCIILQEFLPKSCKILQDKLFLTRILQDTLFLSRILQDTLFLSRILQDKLLLSRSLQDSLFYFKIGFSPPAPILMTYTCKKNKTLQDMNVHIFWHRQK